MQAHANNQMKHHIQQPFFKPTSSVSNTPTSSYFANHNVNKSISHSQQLNIRPVNSPANSYFRPSTPRQREKETEKDRAQSAERIQSLHTRLHQEAEKIRKWKTTTEIELKEKDKKLQDAAQTVDAQRKSILDLQFQNERLSSKLQEELASREEIEHKIVSTRDLCNALKDHVAKVEENVFKGEGDRDELRFQEKKRIEQYQEMVVKFQELEIEHTTKHNEMKNRLDLQKKEHENFVAESQQKMETSENQIKSLQNERNSKEIMISTMEGVLEKKKGELFSLEHETGLLQEKVKKLESIITSLQVQIQNTEEMLAFNKEECKKIKEEGKMTKEKLERVKHENQTQKDSIIELKKGQGKVLDELEKQLSSLINEKDKLEERLQSLTAENESTNAEVKEIQKKLESETLEKEKVQKLSNELRKEKDTLVQTCAGLKSQLSEEVERKLSHEKIVHQLDEKQAKLQEVNTSLKHELGKATKKSEELEEKIRLLTFSSDEKQNIISDLEEKLRSGSDHEKTLKENLKGLKAQIENERKEKEELQRSLRGLEFLECDLKAQISALEEKTAVLEKDVVQASENEKETQQVLCKLQEEHRKLKEECDRMKTNVALQDEEMASVLKQEKGNTRLLREELKEKSKNFENLESKSNALQDQIAMKTKQLKELQQENKSLKSKVTSQTRLSDKLENQKSKLSSEVDNLKGQVKNLTQELKSSREEFKTAGKQNDTANEKIKSLEDEIKRQVKAMEKLEKEAQQFKEEREKAVQVKEQVQMDSEKQMSELCATLEKYKLENEKIVAQKEKELELLRVNAGKETQEEYKKRLVEASEQISSLRKQLELLGTNQKTNAILHQEKEEALKLLRVQLDEKGQKIKELEGRLLEKQCKPKSNSCVREPMLAGTPGDKSMNKFEETTPVAVVPELPKEPRGILRQSDSGQKKRRVVFAGSDEQGSSSSDEENVKTLKARATQASKSKLGGVMEKENKKLLTRTNVRFSPKPSTWGDDVSNTPKTSTNEIQHLKQISRGKPLALQKQKKMRIQKDECDELSKFKELFPDVKSPDTLYDKSPGKPRALQERKTPFKSKITKIKPLANRRTERDESTAWFDCDELFGFGLDDE